MFGLGTAPISTKEKYHLAVNTLKAIHYALANAVDDAREGPEVFDLVSKTLKQLGE